MSTPLLSARVPKEALPQMLHLALPWLDKTIDLATWTTWTTEQVIEGLQEGKLQLWACGGNDKYLFAITEIVQNQLGSSVHIVLGGGQLIDGMVDHITLVENWAKNIGAKSVVIWGRLGWKKPLAKHGYDLQEVIYRRTLKDKMQ